MIIRQMQLWDLDFAADCTESVGWFNETREEFEGFLATDASDGFVAVVDGRRVGICAATSYSNSGCIDSAAKD